MTATETRAVHWRIPATEAAVGPARDRALTQALSWRYCLGEVERQMLKLLVSEMVTNALLYGRPTGDRDLRIAIGMEARAGGILVVVRDHCPTPPAHLSPDPAVDEHGRGVSIMQELAASSGWFPLPDGKAVYALMAAERVPTRQQQRAAVLLDRIRALKPTIRVQAADSKVAA